VIRVENPTESESLLPPQPASSRDKILDVAEALFARRGFAGVGLREVADRVGLGKSSLFHHFKSKAELYLAVLRRVFDRIDASVPASVLASGTHAERLTRTIDALIDALAEHPTTARLLLRGLFEDDDLPSEAEPALAEVEAQIERILSRVLALLHSGIEAGAFRRDAEPGQVLQTLIGAVVYHFASGELGDGLTGAPLFSSDAVRRRKDEIRNMLLCGLSAPRGPANDQGGLP
jgi:TetR/AcrR family transcriptional regulator